MGEQRKPRAPRTVTPLPPRFEVDEIRVQIVVREVKDGETVAKHGAEPLVFVNERAFREWAQQPFNITRREDATA